jgi:hypothetical protein
MRQLFLGRDFMTIEEICAEAYAADGQADIDRVFIKAIDEYYAKKMIHENKESEDLFNRAIAMLPTPTPNIINLIEGHNITIRIVGGIMEADNQSNRWNLWVDNNEDVVNIGIG